MKKSLSPLYGVLAWVAVAAHAQSSADPAIVVPTVPYRSVFADTPKGVETGTLDWRAANTQVGQFRRGHIDILKWEAAQRKEPASTPAGKTATDTGKP